MIICNRYFKIDIEYRTFDFIHSRFTEQTSEFITNTRKNGTKYNHVTLSAIYVQCILSTCTNDKQLHVKCILRNIYIK